MRKHSKQAGEGTLEGIIILAILIIIVIITPKGIPNSNSKVSTDPQGSNISSSNGKNIVTPNSSYKRSISLGIGNARYVYQPYEEYITIYNVGREAINITNWQLKNGKGERSYDIGNLSKYFPSDTANIPQATALISPTGQNIFQDVILKPNETAVVTTGKIGSQFPYKIVSFKENMCSGYLEDMAEYAFTPSLSRKCPRPADEPGVNAL